MPLKVVVVGGGAAGFFCALAAKAANPEADVTILERSAKLLSKVRISGGGRCNVTHACFDPKILVSNYPRGQKELLGPFHRFQPRDTVQWFADRGVVLKKEKDGRMFPITDSSETIIDCLVSEAKNLGVSIKMRSKLQAIKKSEEGFELQIPGEGSLHADRLMMATGSSPEGWEFAKSLGHTIQAPVPSLFTFNIPSFPLEEIAGVSVESATVRLARSRFESSGPLLITHWGFSGPAALKLSAHAARYLAENRYECALFIDWLPSFSTTALNELFEEFKVVYHAKQMKSLRIEGLPSSLWKELLLRAKIAETAVVKTVGKTAWARLQETLKSDRYEMQGKTTNKEEFVTCGGITLSEVHFKTMQSKCCPGLFFCGEILDIDGVTGGFNFQNAWTTGWIAGRAAVMESRKQP